MIDTFPNVASMCCLCLTSVEVQKNVLIFVLTGDTKRTDVTGMEFCVKCMIDDKDNVAYSESWYLSCLVLASYHVVLRLLQVTAHCLMNPLKMC